MGIRRTVIAAALAVMPSYAGAHEAAASDATPRALSADPLQTVLQLDSVATGFASTPQGRMFLVLSRIDGSSGPQVVEWIDGKPQPFPDAGRNSWTVAEDAAAKFVHATAVRIDALGALWIVDSGSPGWGNTTVEHGPKLVKIDLGTNKVVKTYSLADATNAKSQVDDIRFHNSLAYLTDAGSPGIIVLDLQTGSARRVLDGDSSTTAHRPVSVDDHILSGPDGKPVKIHVDQLEVSPDGKFFFYQPASGPLSRIATRYLDDPKLTTKELSKHITTYAKTGSTGGTAIDARGTIYVSDTDKHRIVAIDTDGREQVLLEDPRLLWVDAMWIDSAGYLVLPAGQLDRMAPFNGGVSKLQLPISIYKMKIDAKPSPSDHP